MPDLATSFTGSIPENYHRFMAPIFFEPYAHDLAGRLNVPPGSEILEVACGTGIVTQILRESLPDDVRIVATDLNNAMLEFAAARSDGAGNIHWKQADAMDLPFDDASFDAVVCQFGLMFVPEKGRALAEAFRVLKPGGMFLFNTWDKLANNDFSDVARKLAAAAFSHDPPRFYDVPFSLYDPGAVESMLRFAGFSRIKSSKVKMTSHSPSGLNAARALIEGTPMLVAITERDPQKVPEIVAKVAAAFDTKFGEPMEGKMSAFVFEAVR